MARLHIERQNNLTPKRFEYALVQLDKAGILEFHTDETKIQFQFKGETVTLYPYSGWHTGKSIKDGRGIESLLLQLTQ